MTGTGLSIPPVERSGNSVSPMGPNAECCNVLLQQNTLGQRSALTVYFSCLLHSQSRRTDKDR